MRVLLLVIPLCLLSSVARAVDAPDPRVEVKVQISPREALTLWFHLRNTLQAKGEDEQDGKVRLDKLLGLDVVGARAKEMTSVHVAKCAAIKDPQELAKCAAEPVIDETQFSTKRAAHGVPRDDLLRLVGWLTDKDRATGAMNDDEMDVLVPLRREFKAAAEAAK